MDRFKNAWNSHSRRTINNKTTQEIHYYIGSIEIDARLFEKSVPGHYWGVECLHWFLDVILKRR